MQEENYIEQLAGSYERLKVLKGQRKQKNEELEAECQRDPAYAGFIADKKETSANIKRIKDEAAERTGIIADLNELKEEIDLEQDVIAGCVERLIAEGKLKSGEEFDAGDFTFVPKLRVNLGAQLKMDI